MLGVLFVVAAGIALWLWLRSLGPPPPAGANAVKQVVDVQKADVRVLYGTQTGTAQSFARTVQREGQRLKLQIASTDMEDYEPRNMADENVVVVVVATYGEGEPPDSAQPFYEWLMNDATTSDVQGVKFAVFGLGDRQYKYFAHMGVKIDEKLQELGAERILGLGVGDAGQNLEEDFDVWRQDLWPVIGSSLGLSLDADSENPVEPELTLKTWGSDEATETPYPRAAPMAEPTQNQPAYVRVEANDELLQDDEAGRSTKRVTFHLDGAAVSYQAGDHLAVLPCNDDGLVKEYLQRLGALPNAEDIVSLADATGRNQLPGKRTVREALKWYFNLAGPPKKSTLRAFAHHCQDPTEKETLLSLLRTNEASMKQYHAKQAELRTTLGFLKAFPSCKVPLGFFLEFMPRLTPRFFSISSDQLARREQIVITVARVAGGVCTTMLCDAPVGASIPVFVRKSKFHLPLRDKTRPLIMIGPGTGVAPLVGFCERRGAWLAKGQKLGPAMLFFGCRNAAKDFLHAEFLKKCEQDGVLSVLDACFSRDQPEKVYVQHRLAARAAEVWGLLDQGANLYICGDAKHMAKDVEQTLIVDVLGKHGNMSPSDAADKLKELERLERFHKDVWSA